MRILIILHSDYESPRLLVVISRDKCRQIKYNPSHLFISLIKMFWNCLSKIFDRNLELFIDALALRRESLQSMHDCLHKKPSKKKICLLGLSLALLNWAVNRIKAYICGDLDACGLRTIPEA